MTTSSLPVAKPEKVAQVDTILAIGDHDVGKLISDEMKRIGKDNVIIVKLVMIQGVPPESNCFTVLLFIKQTQKFKSLYA